jgi:hypothetical protein
LFAGQAMAREARGELRPVLATPLQSGGHPAALCAAHQCQACGRRARDAGQGGPVVSRPPIIGVTPHNGWQAGFFLLFSGEPSLSSLLRAQPRPEIVEDWGRS